MLARDDQFDGEGPEQIPGYLGIIWDGQSAFGPALGALEGFDFWGYAQVAHELEDTWRRLVVDFGTGATELRFEVDAIDEIVGSIPGVDAIFDCPEGQGPAGGSGYLLILASGFAAADVTQAAQRLRVALDSDFAWMTACLDDS